VSDLAVYDPDVMHGFPPPPGRRVRLDEVYSDPRLTQWYMRHVRELSGTADVSSRRLPVTPLPQDPMDLDGVEVSRADGEKWRVPDMLHGVCADGIVILRRGALIHERYFNGLTPDTPHLCQSVTKAVASCVAANLVDEGSLDPDDVVGALVPELASSAYADATVRHLLDMSVGIRYLDDLDRPEYDGARLCRLQGVQPSLAADEPGSMYDFATQTQKEGGHGGLFHYVSLNTIVLGWVMERVTGVPVPELIRTRVWDKLGAEHDAYITLDAAGSAQLEGGLCCTLRDLARFGLMLCQGGGIAGRQVVPAAWLEDVKHNGDKAAFAAAAAEWDDARSYDGCSYRSCLWVRETPGHVAFSAVGWLGQRVYVDQAAGVVVAMFSSRPQAREDELGAHAYQACEDLARTLA
jgi:CubicO group peptidase (beta-lactamase class C family)